VKCIPIHDFVTFSSDYGWPSLTKVGILPRPPKTASTPHIREWGIRDHSQSRIATPTSVAQL